MYFLGLNLSTEQLSKELGLNKDAAHYMASVLCSGIIDEKPEITLSGEVECDEVYVIVGHKGNPVAVKKGTLRSTK